MKDPDRTRIAELEAERDSWRNLAASSARITREMAPLVRPDDVVVIDGRWWRVKRWGTAELVPVEEDR